MNIAVFLGAREGRDPVYRRAAEELGQWIGTQGHRLIYGGSKSGLMGVLAKSVLEEGGRVTGVECRAYINEEEQMPGLTELIVTPNIRQRKEKMRELADVFIAFPGGSGTLDEIAEIIALGSIGMEKGVYGFYNINGYYHYIKEQYNYMVNHGFFSSDKRDRIRFWTSLEELQEDLK